MAGDGTLTAIRGRGALRLAVLLVLVAAAYQVAAASAASAASPNYSDDADDSIGPLDEYTDNDLSRMLQPQKRACVRRGGNCDHRPNDCCYNSSCRCNLWRANCRCQRMGLFQKWGK